MEERETAGLRGSEGRMEIKDAPQRNNSEDRELVLIRNGFKTNQKHQNRMIGSNDSLTD